MSKIRVTDLATMMNISHQDLVFKLRSIGVRVEGVGMDVTEHGEEAYTTGDGAILITPAETDLGRRSSPVMASGSAL